MSRPFSVRRARRPSSCCARRCGRSTGRAARATPCVRRLHKERRATHQQGARVIIQRLRARRARGAQGDVRHGRSPGQGRHRGATVPPCAAAASHVGKAAVDDDAGVAEGGERGAGRRQGGLRRRGDRGGRRGHAGGARQLGVGPERATPPAAWPRPAATRRGPAAHSVDVSHRGVGAAEDPLLRLAALELLQGLSRSKRAVQLLCMSWLAQLIDVAEQDDGYGCDQQALRAASRVLAAADTDHSRARPVTAASRGFWIWPLRAWSAAATPTAPRTTCARAWRWAVGSRAKRRRRRRGPIEHYAADAWLAPPPAPKRCQAARLKSLTQAMSPRVWAELVKRGADAALAKAIRDGDDDGASRRGPVARRPCGRAPTRSSGYYHMRACTSFGERVRRPTTPSRPNGSLHISCAPSRSGRAAWTIARARRAVEASGGRGAF